MRSGKGYQPENSNVSAAVQLASSAQSLANAAMALLQPNRGVSIGGDQSSGNWQKKNSVQGSQTNQPVMTHQQFANPKTQINRIQRQLNQVRRQMNISAS